MMTMSGRIVIVTGWNVDVGQPLVCVGQGFSDTVDGDPDDTWKLTILANNPSPYPSPTPNPISGIGRVKVAHNNILQFEEWNAAFNNFRNAHTAEMGQHYVDGNIDPNIYDPVLVDSYNWVSGTILGNGLNGTYTITLSMPVGPCIDEFNRFFMLFSFVSSVGLPLSAPAGDDPPIIYHR